MGPRTGEALSGTMYYSKSFDLIGIAKFLSKGIPWKLWKNKIPLQNNGTFAYYKNIIYLNLAWKPTPNCERS